VAAVAVLGAIESTISILLYVVVRVGEERRAPSHCVDRNPFLQRLEELRWSCLGGSVRISTAKRITLRDFRTL
jgi:hypothetical protein